MSVIIVSVYSKALVMALSQSSCLLCSDEPCAATAADEDEDDDDEHLLRMLSTSRVN